MWLPHVRARDDPEPDEAKCTMSMLLPAKELSNVGAPKLKLMFDAANINVLKLPRQHRPKLSHHIAIFRSRHRGGPLAHRHSLGSMFKREAHHRDEVDANTHDASGFARV